MERLFAPAKLTVSLAVTGVRSDGMHLIEAEMVSLDMGDVLTVAPGSGVTIDGPAAGSRRGPAPEDDLVVRALRMAGRTARVIVTKNVPAGAGLGGGSSDAAAILRWAGVSDPATAVELGADVAFCVRGGRASVSGIGEIVEPLDDVARTFTLLTPRLHCSTPPRVYAMWDELGGPHDDAVDPNDLMSAALDRYPALAHWRDVLGDATGQVPRLAGSGSTWFVEGAYPGDGRVIARTIGPQRQP